MENETHPRPLMTLGDRHTIFALELAHDMRAAGWVPREHVTSIGVVFLGYYPLGSDDEPPYVYDPVCEDCGCLRELCEGPAGYDDLAPGVGCEHYETGCPPNGVTKSTNR